MSKYILMPTDSLATLTGKIEQDNDGHNVDQILSGCDRLLEGIDDGEYSTLNPQDLILMLASSLKTAAFETDPLNDRMIDFLWTTVGHELKDKGILKS